MSRPVASRASLSGFTLLEVLVVVIIIGILSALAYSSITELIFTSRAKETAQSIRTFAERALAEGKRLNKEVGLELSAGSIRYSIAEAGEGTEPLTASLALGSSFSASSAHPPTCVEGGGEMASFNGGVSSFPSIGLSSLEPESGYFAACDAKGYCGAAVKVKSRNSFAACIRRKGGGWEAL